MTLDLSTLDLPELKQLLKDVTKAVETFEARQRREALEAVRAAAKERGFELSDLVGTGKTPKAKAAPKYRHPDNAELTWSGRGRKPKWLVEALENGAEPDDYLIGD